MPQKGLIIREEVPVDIPAIRKVNERAFNQPQEAGIVDELRKKCAGLLSLVAEDDGVIIGHVLFSPVTVAADPGGVVGMGLAPMAVVPQRQREGVGSVLVVRGLELLKAKRCPFVVVLGHADYYPRFGFVPASTFGIKCQWEGVPDDVFMARVFSDEILKKINGVVRYRREFDATM
jgi:putative acetyltransferase